MLYLCFNYLGKQDSYGREFRLVFPRLLYRSGPLKCTVNVLSTVPNPKVFVGGVNQLHTMTRLSDKYLNTNCLSRSSQGKVENHYVKVITSNADISVNVIISFGSEKMLTYSVYPVDTFGTEYIPNTHHKTDCSCNLLSLERTSVGIGYANSNGTIPNSLVVEPWSSVVINALSGNAGHRIISTAPIGVFCCSLITKSSQSFYQLLPSFALGTSYITPRLSSRNLTNSANATLFVHAVYEKTTCQIVDMSNTTETIMNKFNDTFSHELNPEASYNITSDRPIAVGILYKDRVGYSQFIQVPSLKGFVRHTKIAFPLHLLRCTYLSFTLTVYFISQTGALNITAVPLNNMSTNVSYLTYNREPHFAVTVLTGNSSWLLITEPGQLFNDTIKVTFFSFFPYN